MSTAYPGGLDTITDPTSGNPLNAPSHSALHVNENDSIEAIEATLGINPQGGSATVVARLLADEAIVAAIPAAEWVKYRTGNLGAVSGLDLATLTGYKRYRLNLVIRCSALFSGTPNIALNGSGSTHDTQTEKLSGGVVTAGQTANSATIPIGVAWASGGVGLALDLLVVHDDQASSRTSFWSRCICGPSAEAYRASGYDNSGVASITEININFAGTIDAGHYLLEGSNS